MRTAVVPTQSGFPRWLHSNPCKDRAQVLGEMKKAEPHHGERWQRVSKDPQNAHASLETILKKVILDIDNQPAP